MSMTFQTLLPTAGTWCLTFSVPAGYVPVAFAHGALTVASSTDAPAETVYAVDVSAVTNQVLASQFIPPSATTVLFSDNGWLVIK